MAKLTPESPRLFRPTLAAWIGLNESIFLEQLNFILTEVENKGKFADGKKWYRDTPRAFMIQYFPFWDESIVKRTIANLRADALILVRSDLNKDPKDRSLWYTVHYQAIERLSGPVERILNKSVKRKEARKSRKSKPGSYPDYTKVQNVPNAKVQIVEPDDESTKRTEGKVQNVPTPKDSLPKDSKELTPKGVSGKPPPPAKKPKAREPSEIPEGVKIYRSLAHLYPEKALWPEIDSTVGAEPEGLKLWHDVVYGYISSGYHKRNIKQMLEYFRRREIPTTQKASPNGHSNTYQRSNQRGIKALEQTGESLKGERTIDTSTREYVYPDGHREPVPPVS